MLVSDLASRLAVPLEGDGTIRLDGAAAIESAGPTDLSFVTNRKSAESASKSNAGCLVVPLTFINSLQRTILRSPVPRVVFARALRILYPAPPIDSGVHPSSVIAPSARVDPSCHIGPHVSIGENACLGPETVIGPGCRIGADVTLGSGCQLHANVTLYAGVCLGDHIVLHSGCVIGADGFGFTAFEGRYEKFAQLGTVRVGDDVEIGANSCVDRAALGVTSIGDGTKLDNMVHVAHNCTIGRHVVIAAQTGISGGVVVEDYVVIGGQVGIGDRARIETHAVVGSGSGILTSKVVRAGQTVWGTPARPLKQYLKQLAGLSRVGTLLTEFAGLRKVFGQQK